MRRIVLCALFALLLAFTVVGLKNLAHSTGATPVVLASGGSPVPPIPFPR